MSTAFNTLAMRHGLIWRIHFWAALIATPFALAAALTGVIYVFSPQVERHLYAHLDRVDAQQQPRWLDEIVAVAVQSAPRDWRLHSVVPMHDATDSVKVAFMPPRPEQKPGEFLRPNFGIPSKATVVYVNPYSAEVLGSLPQEERFSHWARKLHSNYLQNDAWRWLIELAASWLMVMLVTGVYLWWPSAKQSFLPQPHAKGRMAWKQWHAFVGVSLGLMSAVILTTGLTWSKHAGEQIRWARDATGQTPPRIPASFTSNPLQGTPMLTWEQAFQAFKREVPSLRMQLMPPKGAQGFWRANQIDNAQPQSRFDVLLDAYSGEPLYYSGWQQQTLFGKATSIGIPFHRGEFGVWNQALLFVFGAGVVFSIVSGWVMYFKRHRLGSKGMPPWREGAWRTVPIQGWLLALAMMVVMPLLAISAAAIVVIELGMYFFFHHRHHEAK